jgi:uncharacterized protein YggE
VTVPTLTVVGRAQRDVLPDRVVVSVAVTTKRLPSPQQALTWCAKARRRLLDDLRAAHPATTISDGRITTQAEQRRVKVEDELDGYTEERWEIDGYTGHCLVTLEDDVAAAAAIVGTAGTHPDAERVSPGFVVSPALGRQTAVELEREAVRDALDRAQGLAAAAGMAVGPVLAIGGPDPAPAVRYGETFSSARSMSAGEVEEALGELRPEAETRSDRVTVRVALVAAERA